MNAPAVWTIQINSDDGLTNTLPERCLLNMLAEEGQTVLSCSLKFFQNLEPLVFIYNAEMYYLLHSFNHKC